MVTRSGPDPAVRRRRVVALVLSGIFPGLGQLYNRQLLKGLTGLALGLALSRLAGRAAPTDPYALPGESPARYSIKWTKIAERSVEKRRRLADICEGSQRCKSPARSSRSTRVMWGVEITRPVFDATELLTPAPQPDLPKQPEYRRLLRGAV